MFPRPPMNLPASVGGLALEALAGAACAAFLASCGGSAPAQQAAPPPSPSPAPSPAAITYVALGDSTGFGVGALPGDGGYPPRLARRLREAGRTVKLVNLSVPGATAHDLAQAPLAQLASEAPDLVTVCIGINDATAGRGAAQFGADLDAILDEVAKLRATVVVCNIPDLTKTPRYERDGAIATRVAALDAEIARSAARHRFPVADVYAASHALPTADPSLFSPDGFHPSAAGYELWAQAMFPVVEAALGR